MILPHQKDVPLLFVRDQRISNNALCSIQVFNGNMIGYELVIYTDIIIIIFLKIKEKESLETEKYHTKLKLNKKISTYFISMRAEGRFHLLTYFSLFRICLRI